jgi:type II secretory pathway pseudopilin PulG
MVELLVVVSVIALLAALVLPGLSRAREYAYFTKCKNNLRQTGVGMLVFSTDNRGRMPTMEWPCKSKVNNCGGRRIGIAAIWREEYTGGGSDDSNGGEMLVGKLNSSERPGYLWNDTDTSKGWIGRPRRPGKYLPIEVMWDPIVGLRNWHPFGFNAATQQSATERQRDQLSRGGGIFGYYFLLHSVGCARYQRDKSKNEHVLPPLGTASVYQAEEGYRPMTRNRDIRAEHRSSVWVATCRIPSSPTITVKRYCRPSHFGVRSSIPGEFRFNVLHLGGHVEDNVWSQHKSSGSWLVSKKFEGSHPYGWRFVGGQGENGIEPDPGIPHRFDYD